MFRCNVCNPSAGVKVSKGIIFQFECVKQCRRCFVATFATHLLGSKCRKVSFQACNPSAGVKVWKGIAFRGPVVLVVAAIAVAVVVVVAVVGCNSQLKVGGNNLPPKAAGGNNLPPQFWRQQSATKINNLPPKRWRQQSATKKLAATICHQKVGGNNLPPESLRQQSTSWRQQV